MENSDLPKMLMEIISKSVISHEYTHQLYRDHNADGGGGIKSGMKRIADAKEYILSNWTAAKLRLRHQNGVKGSSTEGHVS